MNRKAQLNLEFTVDALLSEVEQEVSTTRECYAEAIKSAFDSGQATALDLVTVPERDKAVSTLLANVPPEGGRVSREIMERLLELAFIGGMMAVCTSNIAVPPKGFAEDLVADIRKRHPGRPA